MLFISLDSCHIRGMYSGVLFLDVSLDLESSIFLIPICVCEGENLNSWSWFLNLLHEFVGLGDNKNLTFMTDI